MKNYSAEMIIALGNYIAEGKPYYYNIITEKKCPELLLVREAIEGHDSAFDHLMKNKQFVLAAFVSAIWNDDKALSFLIKQKVPQWAATAAAVVGTGEALLWLRKHNLEPFAILAEKIKHKLKSQKRSDLEFLFKGPY